MARRSRSLGKVVWPSVGSPAAPRQVKRVGRNDPCPCGSGKKYKDCHERDGEAFLVKLARHEEKERLKSLRRELKQRGVPWYRRLFLRP